MQYIGLTAFCELGNGFVNDRQVGVAVMGISFRSVMAVSYTHLFVDDCNRFFNVIFVMNIKMFDIFMQKCLLQ